MTLLESIVAFVVLGLVGLACLDLSRGALSLERRSAAWTLSVARAESALAAAEAGVSLPPELNDASRATPRSGQAEGNAPVQVTTHPWRDNLDVIEVVVPMSDGSEFTLSRLIPRAGSAPRVAAALSSTSASVTR